jgi:hypothetical protein
MLTEGSSSTWETGPRTTAGGPPTEHHFDVRHGSLRDRSNSVYQPFRSTAAAYRVTLTTTWPNVYTQWLLDSLLAQLLVRCLQAPWWLLTQQYTSLRRVCTSTHKATAFPPYAQTSGVPLTTHIRCHRWVTRAILHISIQKGYSTHSYPYKRATHTYPYKRATHTYPYKRATHSYPYKRATHSSIQKGYTLISIQKGYTLISIQAPTSPLLHWPQVYPWEGKSRLNHWVNPFHTSTNNKSTSSPTSGVPMRR